MKAVKKCIRSYLIASSLLSVVFSSPPADSKTSVCTSAECKTRGSIYQKNMRPIVNPCEDFYEFACGAWSKQNPMPADRLEWSVISKMQRETLEQLQTILKKPEKRSDPQYVQRAKRVFKICTNIPSLGRGDVDFLTKKMDKIGHFPRTPLWDVHNAYLKLTGESPLFDIQIVADTEHNDEPLLQFKDIKSAFGSFVLLSDWNTELKKAYHAFLENLLKTAWKWKNSALEEKAIIKIVNDVISFRLKLHHVSKSSSVKVSDPLEAQKIGDFQQWYNRFTKQKKSAQINWVSVVRNLYSGVSDAPLLANPTISARRTAYFAALAGLLAETPEETLAHHFEIYFMERHIKLTTPMLEKLHTVLRKTNGFTGYVRNEEMERSLKCVDDMNMDEAEGKLYVENYFKKKNIPLVENILEELKEAIKRDITDSKWLDADSKKVSVKKINDISWWVGYPPWYDNPSITATPFLMEPATINAHLAHKANRICVNAAFIKPPVFDSHLPDVINYGAIGTTMGHEMYHAMDDCATIRYGREIKTWWSHPMWEKCQIRKKCFIEQYTKLTKNQLKILKLPSLSTATPAELAHISDASHTFLEDLPDVMGLQAAYHAYQAKLKKQKNACAVLPNFERFNCDQMFFIAFANSLCGYQVPEAAYSTIRSHSPLRLRINGAVSNNVDFSQAFQCETNSTMNPEKKCNLWI